MTTSKTRYKYKLINNQGVTLQQSDNLDRLNNYVRARGIAKSALYATDVVWLSGQEEALIGYDVQVTIND